MNRVFSRQIWVRESTEGYTETWEAEGDASQLRAPYTTGYLNEGWVEEIER